MIKHEKNSRAAANLNMLESVAKQLGELCNEVVFVGGCTTALFITDSATSDVRPTLDVDCIVNVISIREYHHFESKLKKQGFQKKMNDISCRWHSGNLILDVMPTDEKILGFGNRWYKKAVEKSVSYQISKRISIKAMTAPYFLATKLEAFKGRGNNDFLSSHDIEDIITLIDGRDEVVNDVSIADAELRKFLKTTFSEMLGNEEFKLSLPGHLNAGSTTEGRLRIVLERIKKISN